MVEWENSRVSRHLLSPHSIEFFLFLKLLLKLSMSFYVAGGEERGRSRGVKVKGQVKRQSVVTVMVQSR